MNIIEYLIGIVIIGILAAIAIPQVIKHRDNSVDENYTEEVVEIPTPKIIEYKENVLHGIKCIAGNQVIEINGRMYWIANQPDTWGDLKPLPCK
jgi:type II secretory pathway pseudopilin PulG